MSALDLFGPWITAILHGAGVAVALRAAATAHTAQGAVAWAVALVTTPWLALPAYALFGPLRGAPVDGRVAAARRAARRARPAPPPAPMRDAEDAALRAPLERLAPSPAVAAPPPRALVDGPEILDAVMAAIDGARSHILVQFFIVRDDASGRAVAARLAARARAGVRVLFLYDAVGARAAPRRYWAALREAGVEVRAFSLASPLPKLFRLNFRNHRKVVAVDGRIAIVGGANLADEYLARDRAVRPWRDTAIALRGAAAVEVEAMVIEDWLGAGGDALPAPPDDGADDGADGEEGERAAAPVLLLPTGPVAPAPALSLAFLHLVTSARRRLWIASPYFAPDLDLLSALKLAALRGVDVRILMPDAPDHRITWLAAFAYAPEAIDAGVSLHRYADGFMHQKVMLVDDRVAAVGSANIDSRSFRLNLEVTALVFDRAFAATVADMLARDFARSRPHDRAFQRSRSLTVRMLAPAARLFAPLL